MLQDSGNNSNNLARQPAQHLYGMWRVVWKSSATPLHSPRPPSRLVQQRATSQLSRLRESLQKQVSPHISRPSRALRTLRRCATVRLLSLRTNVRVSRASREPRALTCEAHEYGRTLSLRILSQSVRPR